MNPTRIEIDNIGAIEHGEHDLTNIRMAVVVGANGKGKSTTFTTTPTWVLFGTTKNGCSVDEMIRSGESDMAGTVEFEHQGTMYRVTRTRSKRGRGKSTLEMYARKGDEWESVGGASIAETQAKIKELLGLDAETFTSSSMILQGRAGEFTSRAPAQRKAVLAQILGLEQYAGLQDRAKDQLTQTNYQIAAINAKLEQLDVPEGAWEDASEACARIRADIIASETAIAAMEKALQMAEEQELKVAQKRMRREELLAQAQELESEAEGRKRAMAEEAEKAESAQVLLAKGEHIRSAAAEYTRLKESLAGQDAVREQAKYLDNEILDLKRRLLREEDQHNACIAQLAQMDKALAERGELERAVANYHKAEKRLAMLDKLANEYDDLTREAINAENRFEIANRARDQKIKTLEAEVDLLAGKVGMLANANCIDPENATCRFLADAREAKARLPLVSQDLNNAMNDMGELEALMEAKEAAREAQMALGYDLRTHHEVQDQVRLYRPAVAKLAALDGQAQLRDNLQRQKEDAARSILEIDAQIRGKEELLTKLQQTLRDIEARGVLLAELKVYADMLPALENAQESIRISVDRVMGLKKECDDRLALAETKRAESQKLLDEILAHEGIALPVYVRKGQIFAAREAEKDLRITLGRAEVELERIEKAEMDRQALKKELVPLATEAFRWQTLVRAFGKDGVPAMIIEHAVPELEFQANGILEQMTGGQNRIYFNTQRDKKDGKGIIETLDIMITEWDSPEGRAYETYSGGEQLRIDFALRIALSEMLARRAGSKVEWLTIDEGIGSQDAKHRTLVLDAIRNIASRFKKVILITHIEEAQAMFDEVINL